jgi:tetratricopeptide (TPR) repeat protein
MKRWLMTVLAGAFAFGFYAFYQVFQIRPDGEAPPSLLPGVVPAFALAAIAYWFFGPTAQVVSPTNEAIELLNRGRAAEALARFQQAGGKTPTPIERYNIGIARLFLWQLDEAIAELELASTQAGEVELLKRGGPMVLALATALMGRRPQAQSWLEKVDARDRELGNVLLVHAVFAARDGDFAKAREMLSRHEVKQLGAFYAALAHAVTAWCIEQTQGERRHVDRIALFGETGPERLQKAWPELAAFIERAPAA